MVERMEERVLLAAGTAAANVFAQFEGVVAGGHSSVTIPISFSSSNFTFKGGKAVLGVQVVADAGSKLDAAVVQIRDSRNRVVTPIFTNSNLASKKQSLALADFSVGKYKLVVASERNTSGAFFVKVFLAGDVNGDRQVNANDAKTVKKNLGKRVGKGGYSVSADANLSGTIDAFDVAQAKANNKDRTTLNPLSLAVAPVPALTAVLADGSFATANAALSLGGTTLKNLMVSLDKDGDGFDDGSSKASGAGQFSLPLTLAEGLNSLRVRVADSLGQQKMVMVKVTLDTGAPTFANVGMGSEFQAPGGPAGRTTARAVTIRGVSEPGSVVSAGGATSGTAGANGSFSIPDVVLAMGANALTITARDPAGNTASTPLNLTRVSPTEDGQVVLDWDGALLAAIELNASTPPEASREMAIVHAAIYDAVNAIDRASGFLFVSSPVATGASAQAAVAAAAHWTLSYLFPAQTATFDALLESSLAAIVDGEAKTDGIALGQSVADAMLAMREDDGASNYVPYTSGTAPAEWQPTAAGFGPAMLANWATLTPFAMDSDEQFRPEGPPELGSVEYAADLNEVKLVGKSDSGARTAEQTAMARFWSDGGGTVTAAGHWNQIAGKLADDQNRTLFEIARMFALLDVAMADAAIVAWDAKYAFNFWRPVTAIRGADGDGNEQTAGNETWLPMMGTSPSPEYVSEQSVFGGATAAVLGSIFGDGVAFTATSPFPGSSARTFASFGAAAQETADSQIYGGIQFRSATEDGLAAGESLGQLVLQKFGDGADTAAPTVWFATVKGAVKTNITISGRVGDALSTVTSLQARVDNGVAGNVSFDVGGNFTFNTNFALNGSADGVHTIHFVARDSAGNVSGQIDFGFRLDTKVPTISLGAPGAGAAIGAGTKLSGTVNGTGSGVVGLSCAIDNGVAIPVSFGGDGAFEEGLNLSALAAGVHVLKVTATDGAGNVTVLSRNVTLGSVIPLRITKTSPMDGAVDVGGTVRPKVVFSRAIDTTTLNSNNFFASSGGQKLAATIVPGGDGTFALLFLTNPMPDGSAVAVTVDGSTIFAADSTKLDADGNGVAGGKLEFGFTTVGLSSVANTGLHGIVADPGPDLKPNTSDDAREGVDGVLGTADDIYLHPLAGVTVTILGSGLTMMTGADGVFDFDSAPPGDVKLSIDGNTSSPAPTQFYFPEMVMDLMVKVGADNTVMASMAEFAGFGESTIQGVYLPRIGRSVLKAVGASGTTTIGVDAAAAPELTPQQRGMLSIEVAGGSLVARDGSKMSGGEVGINTVPPELMWGMLPQGILQDTFDFTVQAPGVSEFDTPVAVTFPNVFDAAPGTKLNFLSFDDASGRAVIEGTATVSADGLSVRTEAGQGITHPGWHGLAPPGGTVFSGGAPPMRGKDYIAIKIDNGSPLRTTSDDGGHFSFFVAPDKQYEMTIFDPATGLVSHSTGITPASGKSADVTGALVFNASVQIDSDFDGLPDDIELAIGTNANRADSDGNGINDSVSIEEGLDPNAGRAFPTGVIASLSLSGEAKDVIIVPASRQIAYIATGSGGLAIVDVSQFDRPIALGQIDLPGDAVSVGVDTRLHIAAVASGAAGLQLVNVADAERPVLLQTIGTNARAVAVVDGIAYVAGSGGLISYDLITGEQLQVLPLGGGAVSMAVEGSLIYTMDSSNRLRAIDISGPEMMARGSLVMPEGGGRIFVGNGIVYVAASSKSNGGFGTVDVSDPDNLVLISGSDVAADTGVAGTAIAANGSGLAIMVGTLNFAFGGNTALDLFDTSDLTNTAGFVTRVNLPAAPNAVAIASGIAYVADGTGGLQVVNYAAFDNQGVAPTAMLESLAADAQSGTAGLQVVEGTTVHLKGTVTDDVQVWSVELLVNGRVVASDGSMPFDLSVKLPRIAAGSSTVIAQLRATDSGGNSTLSNVITFNLIADTVAPTIVSINPPAGATRGPSSRSVRVNFSEMMDEATLTTQNIRLLDAANHVATPIDLQTRRDARGVQVSYDELESGTYQVVINAPAIKDGAGNALGGANVTSSFSIACGTIIWINNGGGDWAEAGNWDLGRIPDASDDVCIDVGSAATITHSSGADTIRGLRSKSAFALSGGTLTITNQGIFSDALTLSGGTLDGAGTVTANKNVTWSGTLLEGPGVSTFGTSATVDVPAGSSPAISSRTVNVNGTLNLASSATMSGSAVVNNGGTLNLIGDVGFAEAGGTPAINNSGVFVKASGAGTGTIGVAFNNSGTTTALGGILSLSLGGSTRGRMTAAAAAAIGLNSSAFAINGGAIFTGAGMIRASAGTISVNAAVRVSNLTIEGGSLVAPTGASLTIGGGLAWTAGTIGSGLTVNIANSATLAIAGNAGKGMTAATINNAGTATWSGNGGVLPAMGSVFNNSGTFLIQNDAGWNNNGGAASSFNNSGTLTKQTGAGVSSFGVAFNNTGTINASTGTLALAGGGAGNGTFEAAGGTITLGGSQTISGGAVFEGAGFTRIVGGTTTFAGNAMAQNLALEGGTLDGVGALTVAGTFNWSSGNIGGSGLTRVLAGAALNISGNTAKVINGRTITNEGAATWSGTGNVSLQNASIFTNAGTFTIQNDAAWSNAGGANSTFNNMGAFTKSAGSGTNTFGVIFDNNGSATVGTGTLLLGSGGSSSGTFTTNGSANITFGGNSYAFNDGTTLAGAGMVRVTAGTVSVGGAVSATNLSLEGGTLDGAGTISISGTINWSGGTFAGAGVTTVGNAGTFNISGNGGKAIRQRIINNAGSAVWSDGGGVFLSDAAIFNNSGTFTIQNDATWNNNNGAISTFNNSGLVTKVGGSGTSTFTVVFNNNGTVSTSSKAISLDSGGSSSGIFNATGNGRINFGGGTNTLTGVSSLTGDGTISFSAGTTELSGEYTFSGAISVTGGTANFNGSSTFGGLNVGGGTYGGSGLVHISGTMSWSGGTLGGTGTGAGSTTVDLGGALAISGAPSKTIRRYTLTNDGFGMWTGIGNVFASDGSIFNNSGTLLIQTNAVWNNGGGAGPINNSGIMSKSAGSGNTVFAAPFDNSGTLVAQSGGLQFTSSLTNSGVFDIGSGTRTISISGSFTQTATGTLNVEIGGTAVGAFDKLAIAGTATLGGTLNILRVNGFAASPGDTLQILSFTSRTGTFDVVLGSDAGNGLLFAVQYNSGDVTLTT
ncbi:MAG TPA: Ig-like domain-containing protein [Tepidisphaeraceae bacterium]|nr:Ig-like domain-containing protein [Tepidisphaeraceae bacterium]